MGQLARTGNYTVVNYHCNSQHTKSMMPIPLLVFHLVQALGTLKDCVNLIIKQNNCVSLNFLEFLLYSEL